MNRHSVKNKQRNYKRIKNEERLWIQTRAFYTKTCQKNFESGNAVGRSAALPFIVRTNNGDVYCDLLELCLPAVGWCWSKIRINFHSDKPYGRTTWSIAPCPYNLRLFIPKRLDQKSKVVRMTIKEPSHDPTRVFNRDLSTNLYVFEKKHTTIITSENYDTICWIHESFYLLN